MEQGEVVVGGEIVGVEREGFLELVDGLAEERFPGGPASLASFQLGPLEKSLAEFVDDLVILAKVKATLVELRVTIFEDAAEFRDGLVEESILLVHASVEPGDGPTRSGRIGVGGGALQRHDGVLKPPFSFVNPREIDWTLGSAQLLHFGEGLGGLDELALLTSFVRALKE